MVLEWVRLRRALLGGAIGILVAAVTGCAGSTPQPSTLPTPSRTAAASEPPSPARPSLSPSRHPSGTPDHPTPKQPTPKQPTPQQPTPRHSPRATTPTASDSQIGGARKALASFLAGLNTASARADTSQVEGQWQSTCLWCNTYLQGIDFVHSAPGYTRSGGRLDVGRLSYVGTGGDGQLLFHARMSMSAVRVRDGQGHAMSMFSLPAADGATYTFGLRRLHQRWQVVQGVRGKTIRETQPDQPTPRPTKKTKGTHEQPKKSTTHSA